MVVLVGQSHNVTVNLTREGLCAIRTINITYHPQSITGYDVESNGTVGTLAIIGELSNDTLMCFPSEHTTEHRLSDRESMIVIMMLELICALILYQIKA